MFKKVFYNTSAQIFGKLITASTTLLVTIIIGRSLGEAGFGDFTKIFTFVGYFYTFGDFGLNSIFVKNSKEGNLHTLFRILIGLRLIIAFALAIVAITVSFLLPYNSQSSIGFSPLVKSGIIIASLTILTQTLYTTTNALFQKKLRYDLSTIAAILGAAAVLACAAVLSVNKPGLINFTAVYVIGGLVTVSTAFYLVRRLTKTNFLPLFNSEEFKSLLKSSWPIGAALVLNLIYFRLDILILSSTRPSSEVGIYGLAYQFFEASLAVPIFFSNALYPLLINIKGENLKSYWRQLSLWAKLLTLIAIAQAAALYIVALLIPFIYNGQFKGSVAALQILALGIPFFYLSALLWHAIIIAGRQKHLIFIYGSGAAFNLAANLILIPQYGYLAAATVTVISEALILLLLAFDCLLLKQKDSQ